MRSFIPFFFCILFVQAVFSQVKLNEGSYRNFTQVTDAFGKNPDWIEIYNAGTENVNLNQYHLSDDSTNLYKWAFPGTIIPSSQWMLIFASGSPSNEIDHWETAVREDQVWRWINPDSTTSVSWMIPGFDDSSWAQGQGGFGFGDDDDNTVFSSNKISVYTRIRFNISDTSTIGTAILHMDYDDGFVAYLNGIEIARGNMSTQVFWNTFADSPREALMYQGQMPDEFILDMVQLRGIWQEGENVLAVEGHNSSYESSDMSLRTFLSFGLTDNNSQFGPIPAWFSLQSDNGFHCNFKISGQGETIYLSGPDGQIIDHMVLPPNLPINYSVGSATDGSSLRGIFITATPGGTNSAQLAYTNGYEPAPWISHPGGFYPESINVSISCPSYTAQIRYTINGQIPTGNSPLYTEPIPVNSTTVIKARCFSLIDKLPGPLVTNTFFIEQEPTPAGILSITMDDEHLYGASGIYDNWWTDWKKPCYIEYFEPGSHQPAFKQNSGIKIDGGAGGSRSNPQRSFRVEPGNGTLGDGDINYPLIPSRPDRNNYETFYIRNGSNQYLYYPCKDAIETRCMGEGTNNTYSAYTPVQVYLNGQYWGYYELREKLDEDYFKQHFGTQDDSLEVLSVSYWYGGVLRAVTGLDPVSHFNNDYARFLSLNTSDSHFWNLANKFFDMEYYTDYICAQSWMADTDWPYNNIRIHQSPETQHKWRFSLIDLEWSLNPNGWSNSQMDHISFMLNYDPSYPYIHIWQKAMENNRFHDYFINRFADLMNTNWKTTRLQNIANEIYDVTRPELPGTFDRWGDDNIPVEDYMNQFDNAHQTMISELTQRSDFVREHLKSNFNLPKTVSITLNVEPYGAGFIKISTVTPDTYPWTGIYFDGIPVKIEAMCKPGFIFDHWDSNLLITDLNNALFKDTLSQSATFTAHFTETQISELLTISEINYNSETSIDANDWVEFWNYSEDFAANLSGWYFTDSDPTHVFVFPENTFVNPNARLVVVREQNKFSIQHPGVTFISGFTFGLGGDGDAVKLYDLSHNLIAQVNYADTSPWPLGADGQGRTLELKSAVNPLNNPENWFDGCLGGSPGRDYSPCNEPIVFSEINYNSSPVNDLGDWVEIRNVSNLNRDISGWIFRDGEDSINHGFTFPENSILEPHQQIVLVEDTTRFTIHYPMVNNYLGPFQFGLKNSGEWIRAYDCNGKLKLSVHYNDKIPWPMLANGQGYTLELLDSTGLMNEGINWFAGCYGGSPGKYYTFPCYPETVNDGAENLKMKVFPNPFSDLLTIDFPTPAEGWISLYNYTGKRVFALKNKENHVSLELGQLPTGFYILSVLMQDGSKQTIKLMKQ